MLLAAGLTVVLVGTAGTASGQSNASSIPPLPVDTFRLANGLRVMVSEDHSAPVVAVNTWIRAGSAREEPGHTGLAHLVQRLLYQESVPSGIVGAEAGSVDRLMTRAGGVYSATTREDQTALVEVLPSNRVNLALWLLGQQMASVRITDEALERQRQVAKQEWRLRIGGQPYAGARVAVDTLSQDYAPYRHVAAGSEADLDALGTGDAVAFYRRYYVPANAVLAVVGDVTVDEVRSMAEEFLGGLDAGHPAPDLPEPPPAPRSDGERRAEVEDASVQLPLVWIAYTIPPAGHADRHALELLESILGSGETCRLRERLVDDDAVAADLASEIDLRWGPGTLRFGAVVQPGVSVQRVEARLEEVVEALGEEDVTDAELRKAVNRQRSRLVGELLGVQGRAAALQWHTFYEDGPSSLDDEMARYEAVTAADIRRVARSYLTPENRTVVVARPVSGPGATRR